MGAPGPVADFSRETGVRPRSGQLPRLSPDLVRDSLAQPTARPQEVGDGRLRPFIDGKNNEILMMGNTDVEGSHLLLSACHELSDRGAFALGSQPQNHRQVGRQRGRVARSQSLLRENGGPRRLAARLPDAQHAYQHRRQRPEHDTRTHYKLLWPADSPDTSIRFRMAASLAPASSTRSRTIASACC